jgi:serine/threonine protein kinase
LKPENVLLRSKENLATGEIDVSDVKLCDFGLCENVEDGQMLEDFCGSPGFFAPEIVTTKRHDGKMADIWSVGCILLELTLGHEYFNKMWMVAYDYNLLSKPTMFQGQITESVATVLVTIKREVTEPDLYGLAKCLLCLMPIERKPASDLVDHPWVVAESPVKRARDACPAGGASAGDRGIEGNVLPRNLHVDTSRGKEFTNMSAKARSKFEGDERALPPLEPDTPKLPTARKSVEIGKGILRHLEITASRAECGDATDVTSQTIQCKGVLSNRQGRLSTPPRTPRPMLPSSSSSPREVREEKGKFEHVDQRESQLPLVADRC